LGSPGKRWLRGLNLFHSALSEENPVLVELSLRPVTIHLWYRRVAKGSTWVSASSASAATIVLDERQIWRASFWTRSRALRVFVVAVEMHIDPYSRIGLIQVR
jgi:hypothetical protein